MGEIEWAMWANDQAIVGALVTLLGGILGVAGLFRYWELAAYAIPASILLLLLEYPRGKRRKGRTIERKFQKYLANAWSKLGLFTRSYYIRFLLHFIFCLPCCFLLPTLLGGLSLLITSIIYLVAAIKGEEWIPVADDHPVRPGSSKYRPPARAPPRAPPQQEGDGGQAYTIDGANRI